jgi:hypothetical protein
MSTNEATGLSPLDVLMKASFSVFRGTIVVEHAVGNFQFLQHSVYNVQYSRLSDTSNAKFIPRKSKEHPSNPDIIFWDPHGLTPIIQIR